jgi:hypothetical protein
MGIWYHGTSQKNARKILTSGYLKENTWLAKKKRYAVKFGGPVVFTVSLVPNKTPMGWQICLAERLSIKTARVSGVARH